MATAKRYVKNYKNACDGGNVESSLTTTKTALKMTKH